MKKRALLLNEKTQKLDKTIECELTGCWSDGTNTWEDQDGNYYSLHRIHHEGRYYYYFILEAIA